MLKISFQCCSSTVLLLGRKIHLKYNYAQTMHGSLRWCAEMKWDKADGKGQHYTVYYNAAKVINI